MWPFKKREIMTAEEYAAEEYAATRPPSPCGDQNEHVFWTELQGMRCPVCAGIAEKKREERDENRMAEKIAAAVIRLGTQDGSTTKHRIRPGQS